MVDLSAEDPPASPHPAEAAIGKEPDASNPSPQDVESPTDVIIYNAQPAETLLALSVRFGVQPDEILSDQPIPETAYLTPGQLLVIPRRLNSTTTSQRLIPDSEVVFAPSAAGFDTAAFAEQAGGKLATQTEWLKSSGATPAPEVVYRVAIENSINPRLLLSLMEYQSGWVYGKTLTQEQANYPMGLKNLGHKGLYNQLRWAVDQLSAGYYAYREGRITEIRFKDGETVRLAPELNAGTVALLYFFAQLYEGQAWLDALDAETGFPALHTRMFGDPWQRASQVEPLFPAGTEQPALILPFERGLTWSFTGGPHGAWDSDGAYAALDFAPGGKGPGCRKSYAWALAAASGLVTRSGSGLVVLDLDGDGREETGWVLTYLHIASQQAIPAGTWVDAGDPLGHPSCEGGFSTGTHIHIARKFNGEWIPAGGPLPFNLGGWIAGAGAAAYKGTLTRGEDTLTACTCSSAQTFITRTEGDP
jgi:murein DD-endopeptidase MepM/ murein hydrolase activator NlpD